MQTRSIWTIGHSNHSAEAFLYLLRQAGIDSIADIRSAPYSKRFPHFGKPALQAALKQAGLAYVWLGAEFGARRSEPELLDAEGRLDFAKVRQGEAFRQGLARLDQGLSQGRRIALLCSEADPLCCHRVSMIAVALTAAGITVEHLLREGSSLSHSALEEQLLARYAESLQPDLFRPDITHNQQLALAYRLHNQEVAYCPDRQKRFTRPESTS